VDYELADAICLAVENYFTIAECERYLQFLKDGLDWRKQRVEVGGLHGPTATVQEPRLTLFMSDPGICYEYSGRENAGIDWHPCVLEIKEKAERALVEECKHPPVKFNCVQMNRYDTQRHSLGFHADNEPDLAKGAPIASVSFGATRDFVILDRDDAENRRWTVPLQDGTFFLMGGNMQQRYLHGVPAGGDGGLRINLTFRVVIPRERGQGIAQRSRLEAAAAAEAAAVAAAEGGGGSAARAPAATVERTIPGLPPEQASQPPVRQPGHVPGLPPSHAAGGYPAAAGGQSGERQRFQRRHQRPPEARG